MSDAELRELDARIHREVMGLECGWLEGMMDYCSPLKHDGRAYSAVRIPRYSTDIAAAWSVVLEAQRQHPGWRFFLLGGDTCFGCVNDSPSEGVDESSRVMFHWRAEFFGEQNPRKNYGDRHGEASATVAPLAICMAALNAIEARANETQVALPDQIVGRELRKRGGTDLDR